MEWKIDSMSPMQTKMPWEPVGRQKYEKMLSKIPVFHRELAQTIVHRKAEANAEERGSKIVEEADIVSAFFSEVPKAFYSLMIRLLDEVGFNYKSYK